MTTAAEVLSGAATWCVECNDALAALRGLPSDAFDAVVTDPPFGIGYVHHGGGWGRGIHAGQKRTGQRPPCNSGKPVVGDDAPFDPSPWLCFPAVLLWGANHFAARLPTGGTWLAWDKADGGRGPADSFADCEFAWTNARTKRNVFRFLWKGLACEKAGESNGRRWHPMQKPVALMRWSIMRLQLPPGAVILDPYAGSGATGIAAVQLGYRFIGVEISAAYAELARCRIRQDAPLFNGAAPGGGPP